MNYFYVAVFVGGNASTNTEAQVLNCFYEIYHLRENNHGMLYIKTNHITKTLGISNLKVDLMRNKMNNLQEN